MSNDEYEQALRDAQATLAAEKVRQAMEAGAITFGEYPPDQAEQILADLPTPVDPDATTVPTSVRLPLPLYQKLRTYAEEHGTTASALIRQWIEQMLSAADRPISLADAVRVLSALPSRDQQAA